ncbi:MAG: hypothetical protein AAFU03_11265, partial [Bacteroidota bacterium]
ELVEKFQAGKSAGLNTISIPTSLPKPKTAPTRNRTALFGTAQGPSLEPGVYEVKLTKGREVYTTTFSLTNDPDSPHTAEDRAVQRKSQHQLYDLHQDLAYIYEVLHTVAEAEKPAALTTKLEEAWETTTQRAKTMRDELAALDGDGYVDEGSKIREELGELYYTIGTFPGRPTASQLAEIDRLVAAMEEVQNEFKALLDGSITELNTNLQKAELRPISWPEKEAFLQEKGSSSSGKRGSFYGKAPAWFRNMDLLFRGILFH